MYCTNCGTRVDNGNFCPQCGKPIVTQQTAYQTAPSTSDSLPEGIYLDNKGVVCWIWPERGYHKK